MFSEPILQVNVDIYKKTLVFDVEIRGSQTQTPKNWDEMDEKTRRIIGVIYTNSSHVRKNHHGRQHSGTDVSSGSPPIYTFGGQFKQRTRQPNLQTAYTE